MEINFLQYDLTALIALMLDRDFRIFLTEFMTFLTIDLSFLL